MATECGPHYYMGVAYTMEDGVNYVKWMRDFFHEQVYESKQNLTDSLFDFLKDCRTIKTEYYNFLSLRIFEF